MRRVVGLVLVLALLALVGIPAHATPTDAYWVGNGGYWSQASAHWAATSGGSPGAGNLPDATTRVHFDTNSFSLGSQVVIVNVGPRPCLDMDFTGVNSSMSISGSVKVYGDLILESGITFDCAVAFVGDSVSHTLQTYGVTVGGDVDVADSGTLTLLGNLTVSGGIGIGSTTYGGTTPEGTVDFNGVDVDCGGIEQVGASSALYMRGGTVTVNNFYIYEGTVDSGSSTLVLVNVNGTSFLNQTGSELELNDVVISDSSTSEEDIQVQGEWSIDTFTIEAIPSAVYFQGSYGGPTLTVSEFNTEGTALLPTVLTGDDWTISKSSGVVSCDYLELDHSAATGGATFYAGIHSVDNGDNTGWIFFDLTEVLHYQPDAMISGITLPDLDGTQDGQIDFGDNSDLTLSVGGTSSATSYVSGGLGTGPSPITAPTSVAGYFESVTEPTQMPGYDLFHSAATALGWGTFTLYGVMAIFVAICVGVGVAVATGSALLTTAAVFVGLVVGAGTGQLGWWVVICYGIIAVSFMGATKSF